MYNNYQEQNIKIQKELYNFQKTMLKEAFKMLLLKSLILGFVIGIIKGLSENARE